MQTEFDLHYPTSQIEILGMNQKGFELGNESVTEGRDIPWLQDVDNDGDGNSDVWLNSWPYEYRDVAIVDSEGGFREAYNLTQNDLSNSAKFNELMQKFLDVVDFEPKTRWQSPVEPLDVDQSSKISPIDALLVINELGKYEGGVLPVDGEVSNYVDTDGNGLVGPLDALLVINQLNVIAAASAAASAALPADVAPKIAEAAYVDVDVPAATVRAMIPTDDAMIPTDDVEVIGPADLTPRAPIHQRASVPSLTMTQQVDRDEVFADLDIEWGGLAR